MSSVTYKIIEYIGVIKYGRNGWTKELNVVSWNGRDPKYDIREWDANHEKMARGITLTDDEMATIVALYNKHHVGDPE